MFRVMNREMIAWAVDQYEHGQSIQRIANALFINETTARRHIFAAKPDAAQRPLVYAGSFEPDEIEYY